MVSRHQNQFIKLESHYRPSACRSTTPFYNDRKYEESIHEYLVDRSGLPNRTIFQHDRDKILYSNSFRRLRLKSQVFPEQTGDHLRTRLDHTLEVSQIGRHIARQLSLNEDLVDAIALSHDIGHPPFAHSGERALHNFLISNGCDGFKHNWQGLRVVEILEHSYPDYDGLNLSLAVKIGILKHTKLIYEKKANEFCTCNMAGTLDFDPNDDSIEIFEIQVCKIADDIAQAIHDFEDTVISNMISIGSFVRSSKWIFIRDCIDKLKKRFQNINKYIEDDLSLFLIRLRSEMIYQLTKDLINYSKPRLKRWESQVCNGKIKLFDKIIDKRKIYFDNLIGFSPGMNKKFDDHKNNIKENIISSGRINRMDGKADYILSRILKVYLSSPLQVPDKLFQIFVDMYNQERSPTISSDMIRQWNPEKLNQLKSDPLFLRASVDYIAGMTDRYALKEYDMLYSAYPRTEL